MKTILFILVSLICTCTVNAEEDPYSKLVDSTTLNLWMELRSIDLIGTSDSVTRESKMQSDGWFDWVGDLWDWATQPFRPVWGWYEEGGNKINS